MAISKIIYLHGFGSSGQSLKGQQIKAYFEALADCDIEVVNPSYRMASPDASIRDIEAEITKNPNDSILLIGSSLGGFYAQYFGKKYQLPWVMINPALSNESVFKSIIGHHHNVYTDEEVEVDENYLQLFADYDVSLADQEQCLVFIDQADEVVDYRYAQQIYQNRASVYLYPQGSHAFDHMEQALEIIEEFIKNN